MSESKRSSDGSLERLVSPLNRSFSRRDLLKGAATGAGMLALGGSVAGFLEACGSSSTPAASSSLGPDTTGTLTVWHYSSQQDVKTVQDYTALFTQKFPKVTVNLQYVEFSVTGQRAIAAAAAKQGPDVFIYGGNEVNAMYQAGVFKDIDSYWQAYADKGQFPDGVITRFNNHVYGVKGYVNLTGLWYNKTILDAVGVQPPTSIDGIEDVFAQIKAKKYVPIALTGQPTDQGDWTAFPWLTSNGFTYKNPDQAAIQKTFELVSGWARNGYLPKESVSWGQAETFTRWAQGDVAFMENGNWNIGPAQRTVGSKFQYGTAPLPGTSTQGIFLGGEALWVGAFTKNPDLAFAYMKETLLSQAGLLITLKESGGIPARHDMANLPDVTNNPLLAAYTTEVKDHGSEYPPEGGAAIKAQAVIAQNWSAAIAGQKSPSQAASDASSGVKAAYHP